jgi:hypothetical protein
MGAQVGDAGELRSLFVKALALLPERRAEFLSGPAALIARRKDSKRPIGSVLPDLQRTARLLGMPDFTSKASGLQ